MFYGEELTTHTSPESWANNGNLISEALTGESVGWVLSPVIDISPSADVLQEYRRQHFMRRYGEEHEGLAGSETPCMHGNYLDGNREALYLS